jgi:hypothetical protein
MIDHQTNNGNVINSTISFGKFHGTSIICQSFGIGMELYKTWYIRYFIPNEISGNDISVI